MYLVQRGRRWWAFHDVPKALESKLGVQRRFAKNLDTADRRTAENRAAALESQWRRRIEAARAALDGHEATDAEWWNATLRAASDEDRPAILERIRDEAQEIALADVDPEDPDNTGYDNHHEATRFYRVATGAMTRFDAHLADWVKTLRHLEQKTIDMRQSNVAKFAKHFPYVGDVKRKGVQQWIDREVQGGKKPATIRRMLSELRGYWGYLVSVEAASEDILPFEKLTYPKVSAKEAHQDKRRGFTSREVVRLLKEATKRKDSQLADLIRLGMWTGARLEELCALKTEHVTATRINIVDSKTPAGIRKIPVHSKLTDTVKRLKAASRDGYLISGLPANQYGDRGPSIGKRFTRLKTDLEFGSSHVFHSIRHTVATLLKNAEVQEAIIAEILGHEHDGFTLSTYGDETAWKTVKSAVERLAYPL